MTVRLLHAPAPPPVPTLDDLVREPVHVEKLEREAVLALLLRVHAVHAVEGALLGRLLALDLEAQASPRHAHGDAGPEWLTADRVHPLFGLDARWLADHAPVLDGRRIRSRVSRKHVVYHAGRLRQFLEAQCRA